MTGLTEFEEWARERQAVERRLRRARSRPGTFSFMMQAAFVTILVAEWIAAMVLLGGPR